MENVNSSTKNNPRETRELDLLLKDGRKLHSEAVFLGILKILTLFRHDFKKAVQLDEKQGNLKYSH